MALQGERFIGAPREAVLAALNDAAVLQACIPGCETIEKLSGTEMNLISRLILAGVAGRFTSKLVLPDIQTPDGYTIFAEGQDDSGSSFSGHLALSLADADGATRLTYHASAKPIGPLATAPPDTLEAAAGDDLHSFFSRFATMVAPASVSAETQLQSQGVPPAAVVPVLETVPPVAIPHDPAAQIAHAEPFHPPAHEDHDHDPSNPHYFGLPIGVILAGAIAGISVFITIAKFLG